MIYNKLRPVLDLLLAARPNARDYMRMRAAVRTPPARHEIWVMEFPGCLYQWHRCACAPWCASRSIA